MAEILTKPIEQWQKDAFLIEYNHKQNKRVHETDIALYALEPWELLDGDTIIDNSKEYKKEQAIKEKEAKRQEILKQLDSLDIKSIRAIRAGETEYIALYEEEAKKLRKQLQEL